MEAVPLLLGVGVKVAVRVRPEPLMAERLPPVTLTSPLLPFQAKEAPGSSEKLKLIVAVPPSARKALLLLMERLGALVSSERARAVEAVPRLPTASVTATEKV